MSELMDIYRDPDELTITITEAYHRHVEAYLATTSPPEDAETAVSRVLLGSPLLGLVSCLEPAGPMVRMGYFPGPQPLEYGQSMGTFEGSSMDIKRGSLISINGPDQRMSKAHYRP